MIARAPLCYVLCHRVAQRTGVRVGRRAVKSVANRSATNGRQENPRQDAPTSTFRVQSAGLRQAPAHRRPSAGTEARSERRRVQPPFFNGSFSVPFGPIARGSPTAADSTTPNPVAGVVQPARSNRPEGRWGKCDMS